MFLFRKRCFFVYLSLSCISRLLLVVRHRALLLDFSRSYLCHELVQCVSNTIIYQQTYSYIVNGVWVMYFSSFRYILPSQHCRIYQDMTNSHLTHFLKNLDSHKSTYTFWIQKFIAFTFDLIARIGQLTNLKVILNFIRTSLYGMSFGFLTY